MTFSEWIENIGRVTDAAGVGVMVFGIVLAVVLGLRDRTFNQDGYRLLRQRVGRSILLGLELLVAADIIRTVAVRPHLESVAVLALIVLIRTFLSFSLELEISGRWPWQKRQSPETNTQGV